MSTITKYIHSPRIFCYLNTEKINGPFTFIFLQNIDDFRSCKTTTSTSILLIDFKSIYLLLKKTISFCRPMGSKHMFEVKKIKLTIIVFFNYYCFAQKYRSFERISKKFTHYKKKFIPHLRVLKIPIELEKLTAIKALHFPCQKSLSSEAWQENGT